MSTDQSSEAKILTENISSYISLQLDSTRIDILYYLLSYSKSVKVQILTLASQRSVFGPVLLPKKENVGKMLQQHNNNNSDNPLTSHRTDGG